ncbi:MAG: helix-turn-helix transcriptional regulator [Bacteroidales bacterium]|nr:helix-turn-helix transcriptional regulator [Bacteroidales bacterium]
MIYKMEQRLQLFLQMEQLSQSQFADKMGIQRSGVTHLLSGRNKPSYEFIAKMLQAFPSLNAEWLILGKGKPYKDSSAAAFEAPVTDPEPPVQEADLFTEMSQPEVLVTTETIDFGNNIQSSDNKRGQQDIKLPGQPKAIKSILILYEDGTYEKR